MRFLMKLKGIWEYGLFGLRIRRSTIELAGHKQDSAREGTGNSRLLADMPIF